MADANPAQPRGEKGEALARFESATAWPMLVLALAIIPLLLVPLVVDDLSERARTTVLALEWFIWAAFVLEYGIRLFLAPEKWTFIRGNKIDLVVVIIPFLRPLRVARSARLLRALRALRAVASLLRAGDAVKDVLTRHKLHYALLVTMGVVVSGALLVESFEHGAPEGNISSVPDALWWAITTVTTVGYGDRFPTTPEGRAVGVVLMVVGIALFGFLAGSLASFFLERDKETEPDPQLTEINDRLARIERELKRRTD